jgi:RNA polymerase sigma factor (sigma-70 family)
MRNPEGASDQDLITAARAGDRSALAVLWQRHSGAAFTVARSFTSLDADDVVSEAFAKVLAAIRKGGGPTSGFRPYLVTAVRNVAVDWGRAKHTVNLEDIETLESGSTTETEVLDALERGTTAAAFRSLPSRWQEVLWYVEVEGMAPRHVAVLLGMKPNSVAALAVRAREGLRQAWIRNHLTAATTDPECRRTIERLPAYARGTLGPRLADRVNDHLESCASCQAVAAEAANINGGLALILLPLAAGVTGATAYLGTLHHAPSATVSASTVPTALGSARPRGVATASGGMAKVALVAAGFVVIASTGVSAAVLLVPAPTSSDAGNHSDVGETTDTIDATEQVPPATELSPAPAPSPSPAEPGPQSTEPGPEPGTPSEPDTQPAPPAAPTEPALVPRPTPAPPPEQTPSPTPTPDPDPPLAAPTMTVLGGSTAVYPVLSGLSEAGAVVTITTITTTGDSAHDAEDVSAWTTTSDPAGRWTVVLDGLRPGTSHVTAQQTLQNRSASPRTAPATVQLDPPPVVELTEEVPGLLHRITVTGTPGAAFRIFTGTWESSTHTLDATGHWTLVAPEGNPVPTTITVRYVDGDNIGAASEPAHTASKTGTRDG